MGQIKLIGGVLMALVFTIAIVSYVTQFADDNNVAVDLGDDPELSSISSTLKTQSSNIMTASNSSSEGFTDSAIEPESGILTSIGVFLDTLKDIPTVIYSVLHLSYVKIFGQDVRFGYVFTAISTFFVIVGIFYAYKTLRGNPD